MARKTIKKSTPKKVTKSTYTKIKISGLKASRGSSKQTPKLSKGTLFYLRSKLISSEWKYNAKTRTISSVGKSPFTKKELKLYQQHINKEVKAWHKSLKEFLVSKGHLRIQDNLTDKQLMVIQNLVVNGYTIDEFASKYPDAFLRIFEEGDAQVYKDYIKTWQD